MTWGSHCPVCGGKDCSWAHGQACEGKHRALEAKLERYEKTLAWYGDEVNYRLEKTSAGYLWADAIEDGGKRAREALDWPGQKPCSLSAHTAETNPRT